MNNWLIWIKRILFILAALWAIWASLNILFVPMTTQEVFVISADGSQTEERTTSQISWYEAQGWWGVTIVVIFAFLYLLVGSLAYFDYLPGLAISSFFALVLTVLAALSIGGAYAPSLLGMILGWLFLGFEKILSRKWKAQ
jgi:hypothetical protein